MSTFADSYNEAEGRVVGVEVSSLATMLEERRFGECREAAEQFLRGDDLSGTDRAQAFLALSCSLFALHTMQEAIGPAELAVFFSRQCGDYDLTGRSLCHLAILYYETGLHKRAVSCLDEYFHFFSLYRLARGMEGWVLAHLGLFHEAMGRTPKALEYYRRGLAWHVEQGAGPGLIEALRGDLTWLYLKAGRLDQAAPLLADSAAYLLAAPNDLEARARYQNSLAYRHYLTGSYSAAVDTAVQVVHMRGAGAVRKTHAFLTLHYAARAMGLAREAMGLGTLARIQAGVAKRPDLAEEAVRSMLHIQRGNSLPLVDELLQSLRQAGATNEK